MSIHVEILDETPSHRRHRIAATDDDDVAKTLTFNLMYIYVCVCEA